MERFFTKTFLKFFLGFVAIIAVAFGVLIVTSAVAPDVDNVAAPR